MKGNNDQKYVQQFFTENICFNKSFYFVFKIFFNELVFNDNELGQQCCERESINSRNSGIWIAITYIRLIYR